MPELSALRYLASLDGATPDPGALAFFASLDQISTVNPTVAGSVVQELTDQRSNVKLIASENFSSLAVQLAQGNLFTDKYAEGAPGHRFYAGCDNVDTIEAHAADLAKQLFGAEHAYVQPHSGIDANLVAFLSILATRVESGIIERFERKNASALTDAEWAELRREVLDQKLLGMDYYSGGHLTHGYRFNVSARLFDARSYTVDRETKLLDLDAVRAQVREVRPLILLAGYSAYTRLIDFAALREIADEVGAVLMVDMAHFAGLVAGKVFSGNHDPVAHAHVVTSTTHKTLRGPRGGMVLCTSEFADAVDKGCPTVLGGPLPHAIAAKAVAFTEALEPSFAQYAANIVDNARTLADQLQQRKVEVLTGGTDNHIVLVDVAASYGLTGRQAESALRSVGLTLNRNSLPFDANGPWYTSGLRLGTPAVTTLGMGADQITEIADVIATVLAAVKTDGSSKAKFELDGAVAAEARTRTSDLLRDFPLYPEIDLSLVK
ncbi:glycine hydroxymethyltransferase [Cryptosporangium sp. NPDC048952]|uniref:glycine hydroxymethyltransferase n=1 Tax=Cryptosporangium sp. NPDC048952 TaxID=3363961 RepID=UPI00371F77F9